MELRKLLESVLPQRTSFEDYEVAADFPRIGHRVFALNVRRLERDPGRPAMILLALEDVTAP